MGDFIKNSPFRFWCQKVLPLVYDDSLSYYELLCKVVGKLNELAENQNNLSDEIKAVAKDLDDFKAQVPGMVEAKVEEWLNNYIATHDLVNSVNGMTGVVTLTAADVGAIANVNGSVKNNNIADGAVTSDKIAAGVIPTKLPNPQKLTFTGAVTGEYDGSQAVNIDIPAGGGGSGGGAVNSVNGMTGAVVLKKITFTGAATGEYNGSQDLDINIPEGGTSEMKPLHITGGATLDYDGSAEKTLNLYPFQVCNPAPDDEASVHTTFNIPVFAVQGGILGVFLVKVGNAANPFKLNAKEKKRLCSFTVPRKYYAGNTGDLIGGASMIGYTGKPGQSTSGGIGNFRITVECGGASGSPEADNTIINVFITSFASNTIATLFGEVTVTFVTG